MKKFIIEVSKDGSEFQNIYGDYVEALDFEQALEFLMIGLSRRVITK